MKTHGICNAQSARKHRRAGHLVQRFPDGRYQWQSQGTPQMFGRAAPRTITSLLAATNAAMDDTMRPVMGDTFPDGRTLTVGASYWPKRRNQHSKPFKVLAVADGQVTFARGDDVVSGQMDAELFLETIGKSCN